MGLCASKDKKDKVIEGDGAANATANGEPNGTATTASAAGEAAGQEGCVFTMCMGGGGGGSNGACHRSQRPFVVCLCVCVCI